MLRLSDEAKKSAFLLNLDAKLFTFGKERENIIKLKYAELKKRIGLAAALSGFGSLIPFPGLGLSVDIPLLFVEIQTQKGQLGLDDDALKRKSEMINKTKDQLIDLIVEQKVKEPIFKLERAFFKHLLISFASKAMTNETLSNVMVKSISWITTEGITLAAAEVAEITMKVMIPIVGYAIAAIISASSTASILMLYLKNNHQLALACNEVMRDHIYGDAESAWKKRNKEHQ